MNSKNVTVDRILKERGLTWYWLGQKSKVSLTTLYNFKNGVVKNVEFSTMEKIADALDVSLDEFRGD
jgi:DNA-binding Xre family transcriptional regulator